MPDNLANRTICQPPDTARIAPRRRPGPFLQHLIACLPLLGALVPGAAAHAQAQAQAPAEDQAEERVTEVLVRGSSLSQLGTADAASQGAVAYADLTTRPLARVGELVEAVPGMIAAQHSGPGKANQYYLRGFNLDHGADFSTFFDGMPVNFRTHAHAQGYMDLNFIIPELVERVDYRKGPYFADTGDFSLAGSSAMKTRDSLERGFTELTLGSEDELRLLTADSFAFGAGAILYALEHHQADGHFVLEEDLRKYNGLLKYTGPVAGYPARVTFSAYDSEWVSTDQVPLRAVENGLIDRFGFIDPDLGGESRRWSLSGNLAIGSWDLNLHASSYYLSLLSNPTFQLNDPVNGDQLEQEDARRLFGGSLRRETAAQLRGVPVVYSIGADWRHDDVHELNLFQTAAGVRRGSIREDTAAESSLGAFADLQFSLSESLRATMGLRLDYFDFRADSLIADNAGSGSDALWQPKLGLAWRLGDNVELYANHGRGFHSNDVRVALDTVDPLTGAPTDSQDVIVRGEGSELGIRYDSLRGFNASLAWFELRVDSELIFVGDAGTTEPGSPTRRKGVEFTVFREINGNLVVDFRGAWSDGHFVDRPSGENAIPDAHDLVASVGITYAEPVTGWVASLQVRHFSEASLSEDERIRKDGSTLLNLGVSHATRDWEIGLDVLNLLDRDDDDIAYWYESRLADEAAPVEDVHFHPSNPRAFRVLLKYKF